MNSGWFLGDGEDKGLRGLRWVDIEGDGLRGVL